MSAIHLESLSNILTADIGGTNSRFAHFTAHQGKLSLVSSVWLKTAAADSFPRLLKNLQDSDFPFNPQNADIVGIAIAGPVIENVRSYPPLIPWGIDISQAHLDYGFKHCFLINDFVAQAFSCLSPVGQSAQVILAGSADAQAVLAVIGAGTGLGKAILVPDGRGGYNANPSEGAHACFPFIGEREYEFQQVLTGMLKEQYVTYNHVVSGKGLSAIHEFLTGKQLEPSQIAELFPLHPETLAWCARFYGRACRDFALETFALGGLYIAGGIAARNPEIVYHEAFRTDFLNSATMHHLLARLPVLLISDQNSGLWGVAVRALQELT